MPELVSGTVVASVVGCRNPFPGLRPFHPDEEHLFFGRENQVDRMVDKLARRRFLAVVGTSGSGKSSLVDCGLRPALHRGYMARAGAAWRIAQFRPGDNPIGAMARALACPGVLFDAPTQGGMPLDQLVDATLRLGSLGLVDIIEQARLKPGDNLLLVVDQFEELFRFNALSHKAAIDSCGPGEDAIAFVRLLLEAAAQDGFPIYIVLTMRSDFLGECAQFHGLPEAINEGQYLVPRLTRDEIRAVITGPVSVAHASISPVLLTRLLNDVGDNPDQLSILQHALNRAWANWQSHGSAGGAIELAHYEAIGGMQHALDQHAEKAFGEMVDSGQKRLCERVFKALTDKGADPRGIRRPTRLSSLCAITGATQDEVVAVIDRFREPSRSFLMPPLGESLAQASVIDISHESLMRVWGRLAAWADEEAQSAQHYRRLLETAVAHAAGRAGLLRDPDLQLALDWRASTNPNAAWASLYGGNFETAVGFLAASKEEREKDQVRDRVQRLRKRGLWIAAPLALVFALLSIIALKQARQAEHLGSVSLAALLAARSQFAQAEQVDLEPGVLLAVEALQRAPSPDNERALRQAVAHLPRQITALALPAPLSRSASIPLVVSTDGRTLAAISEGDTVRIFDTKTWHELSVMKPGPGVRALAFSAGGTWLAVSAIGNTVRLVEAPDGREIRRFSTRAPIDLVAMSRDGRYIVTVGQKTATIFDAADGREAASFSAAKASTTHDVALAALSPDGRWLALGTNDTGHAAEAKDTRSTPPEYRVRLYDSASGKESPSHNLPGVIRSLAFSADGRWLAVGGEEGAAKLLDFATGKESDVATGSASVFDVVLGTEAARLIHPKPVTSVGFSNDARWVATGSADGAARVFDPSRGTEVSRLVHRCNDARNCAVRAVAFGRDGRWVVSGGDGASARVAETAGADEAFRILEKFPVTAMAFAAAGRRLMTGSGDIESALVRVFDAPHWQEVVAVNPLSPEVTSVAMSESGRSVAITSNWGGGPWMYDLARPEQQVRAFGGPSLMKALSLSGDGLWVAAVASFRAHVFEVVTGKTLALPDTKAVHAVALSADGRSVAIGAGDIEGGKVHVFELPDGKASWQFAQNQPVLAVALSFDGKWLATASGQQGATIRLVDAAEKKERWSRASESSTLFTFSPDGQSFAIVGADGTLRVFQTSNGQEVSRILPGHRVGAIRFAEQGRHLIAASVATSLYATPDVVVTHYHLRQDAQVREACLRVTRNLTPDEWAQYVGAEPSHHRSCDNLPFPGRPGGHPEDRSR